jgi:Winged helix-turn-helix DNA-binding
MAARPKKVTLDLFSIPIKGVKQPPLRPVWEQFGDVDPQAVRDRIVYEHLQRFLTEESIYRYADAGEAETVAAIEYLLTQLSLRGALLPDEPHTKRSIAHLLNLLPQEEKIRAAIEYLYSSGAMWRMSASKEMHRGSSLLPPDERMELCHCTYSRLLRGGGFDKLAPLSGDPAADGEAIRGWLWTAMRYDFLDRFTGEITVPLQRWDQPYPSWDAGRNPADYVPTRVDLVRLESRLPKGALLLVYRWKVDRESQAELARELGIPQTTLSYRLNRLMHLLRAYFMLEEMDTLPPRANPTDLLARREQMLAALEELWATQPAPRPQPLRRAA